MCHCIHKYIPLTFLFISHWLLTAQTTYITDSTYFEKVSKFYFLNDSSKICEYTDTSVIHFQNSLPFYFNGQIGTAQPDYLLENKNNASIGSRILSIYFPDEWLPNQKNIYRTKGFFAKINGIAGSKDEQHFNAEFLSPLKKNSQINFLFRRSTNTGFYQSQKGSVSNLLVDYHFFGNKKFSLEASVILNFIKYQENGGIVKDTLSYNDIYLDKILLPVNLNSAKKNFQSQYLHLQTNYLINNKHALSLSINYERKIFQYQDNNPQSGYYAYIFLDTIKTNDSLHSFKINLPVSYTFRYRNNIDQISYQYQYNPIYLYGDTIMQNHFILLNGKTTFQINKAIKIHFTRNIQYIFTGTQKNNYSFDFNFNTNHRSWTWYTHVIIRRQSPAFQQNYWYSNHFIWLHHFKDIFSNQIHLSCNYHDFIQLNYHFYNYINYIYFYDNYPVQNAHQLNIHQFKISIDKVFFRHLGIHSTYYYQLKNSTVIALPKHFLRTDIYYQGRWFHKNLLVNSGMQFISSLTGFDAYQYNPATSIYSISSVLFQTKAYPQLAIYFSGRIKPVNFFIRMDYLLSGIYPHAYYYIPHYMMPDRSFRMGISWMFFD